MLMRERRFKDKEVIVALVGNAKETYLELKQVVKKELKERKLGTDNQKLLKSIDRTIEILKLNPQFGIHIKGKQIPEIYVKKYSAENLWKCNLFSFWRIIYWIDGSDEIKIVNFILDIINHKKYNKTFGYRND